jgi:hypothetical protein
MMRRILADLQVVAPSSPRASLVAALGGLMSGSSALANGVDRLPDASESDLGMTDQVARTRHEVASALRQVSRALHGVCELA